MLQGFHWVGVYLATDTYYSDGAIFEIVDKTDSKYDEIPVTLDLSSGNQDHLKTNYALQFKCYDVDSFSKLKGYAESKDKVVIIAYGESSVVWLEPSTISISRSLSGDTSTPSDMTFYVKFDGVTDKIWGSENLLSPTSALGSSGYTASAATVTYPTKNGSFTTGDGKVVNIVPSSGGTPGLAKNNVILPYVPGMQFFSRCDAYLSGGTSSQEMRIKAEFYEATGSLEDDISLVASGTGVKAISGVLSSPEVLVTAFRLVLFANATTAPTAEFDNILLSYGSRTRNFVG